MSLSNNEVVFTVELQQYLWWNLQTMMSLRCDITSSINMAVRSDLKSESGKQDTSVEILRNFTIYSYT